MSVKGESSCGSPDGQRNRRSVWTVATSPYSGAHFATFPPKLVEPMILAGCPAQCCPVCGKGWERVVEKVVVAPNKRGGAGVNTNRNDGGMACNAERYCTTLGFRPTCSCGATESVPGVVFDPFVGSGTSLLVARALGRRGVGMDLSWSSLSECARPRLELDKLEAWENGGNQVEDAALDGLPLFERIEA